MGNGNFFNKYDDEIIAGVGSTTVIDDVTKAKQDDGKVSFMEGFGIFLKNALQALLSIAIVKKQNKMK